VRDVALSTTGFESNVRTCACTACGGRTGVWGIPLQTYPRTFGILGAVQVLVVDDNVDAADTLGMMFRLANYAVDIAYNGHAALRYAALKPPAVAFLDLNMPELSGYEVARQLREIRGCEAAVLVAVTGFHDRVRPDPTAFGARFDFVITKPASTHQLFAIVRDVESRLR
jgi:DNA-binding response OmpR family regulator